MKHPETIIRSSFVFALMLVSATAFSAPLVPHIIYGNITVDGQPAAPGTEVDAADQAGIVIAHAEVSEPGKYGFLAIPGDDASTPGDEGAVAGETVSFFVNRYDSGSFLVWESGTMEEMGLSAETASDDLSASGDAQSCTREIAFGSDRAEYSVSDKAIFFGNIMEEDCSLGGNLAVDFSILNAAGSLMTSATVRTDIEGSFEISAEITSAYTAGLYTAHAAQGETRSSTSFSINLQPGSGQQDSGSGGMAAEGGASGQSQTSASAQLQTNNGTINVSQPQQTEDGNVSGSAETITDIPQSNASPPSNGSASGETDRQEKPEAGQPEPAGSNGEGISITTSLNRAGLFGSEPNTGERLYFASAVVIFIIIAASYIRASR